MPNYYSPRGTHLLHEREFPGIPHPGQVCTGVAMQVVHAYMKPG